MLPLRSRTILTVLLQVASLATSLATAVACSQSTEDAAQAPVRPGSGNGNSDSGTGGPAGSAGANGSGMDDSGAPPLGNGEPVAAMIGPEGGMVIGPNGSSVQIPEGALDEEIEISVSVAGDGFGPLPALANGAVFAFEPHGQVFNQPVTISIPHAGDPAELALFTSEVGGDWVKLHADIDSNLATIEVSHFSFFFNGREVCGLDRQECCTSTDGADGECSGDALACVDGRCMECGFSGEPCCPGDVCHEYMCVATTAVGKRCGMMSVGAGGGPAAP